MFSIVRDPCIFYPAFAPFTFVALPFVNDSCTVDVCFGHAQLVDWDWIARTKNTEEQ